MKYTPEMNLESASGYCMPFPGTEQDVQASLAYGQQIHPKTKEPFFHHGVDFVTNDYDLSAVATGRVTGLGTDAIHGAYQIVRYGGYEVTYAHLTAVMANYGERVKAGQIIARCGKILHISVKYKGEEIDPNEFLLMIYENASLQGDEEVLGNAEIHSKYDDRAEEIEDLFMNFYPSYIKDIEDQQYQLPEGTVNSLLNLLLIGKERNYFFETIPTFTNPMGLGLRSQSLIEKAQNLLIEDFLNYIAFRNARANSSNQKKK